MIRDAFIFIVVITVDRITKVIVPHFMDLHQSIPVIPNLFNFTYSNSTTNRTKVNKERFHVHGKQWHCYWISLTDAKSQVYFR